MDITLDKCFVFDLPSQNRVGAIVHGGAADGQLWPGKGADTDLRANFGDELQEVLDTELRNLGVSRLELGHPLRVGRGRLHCDFLVWVALREPEPGAEKSPAPKPEQLRQAVKNTLAFVAERGVERVAFTSFSGGKDELAQVERWLEMAKAAQEYADECRAAGRSTVVEEVLLCEGDAKLHALARSRLGVLARSVEPVRAKPEPTKKAVRKAEAERTTARRNAPKLARDEVDRRRLTSAPYSMKGRYSAGDFVLHARFGVGRVESVLQEGAVTVLFEDGEIRKMVHGRT